jgi:hypothetical protein
MSVLRNLMTSGVIFAPLYEGEGGGGGAAGAGSGGTIEGGGAASTGAGGAAAGAAGGGAAGAGGAGAAAAGGGAGGGASLAEGGSGGAAAAAAAAVKPGELPANWDFRAYLSNGDTAVAKDLEKYTDPRAVYTSLRDLQTKISKGELKAAATPFPAQGTDEQKTAWRQANGLPATKDDYGKNLKLPDGVVLGEADKPFVDSFAQSLFEQGATQSEFDRALSWWVKAQDTSQAARSEADGRFKIDSEVALRTEWTGAEFAKNMNAFGAFRSELPDEVQSLLFTARTADGQVLGNHPAFIKIGAALGRALNPAASIVLPSSASGGAQTADARIKEIDSMMYKDGKANPEYFKNEAIQKEYRDLVDARDAMKKRGGRAA